MTRPLEGRITWVAGATRGAGRAIACCLGEAGATVWISGRSVRGAPATAGRPETLEETAEMIEARGGRAVVARADHTKPGEVEAVARRIDEAHGKLDVLVNDIWGGDALSEWGRRFWELTLAKGHTMLERGLWTHVVTACIAAPLVMKSDRGLIVEVGDGEGPWYRDNFFYDLVKASVLRIAFGMSVELRSKNVAVVAVTPGFLRSEAMLDHFGVTEQTWRDAIAKDPHFAQSETPALVGRAVASLAADPAIMERSGRAYSSGTLAEEYGFTDVDGSRPNWTRYFRENFAATMVAPER